MAGVQRDFVGGVDAELAAMALEKARQVLDKAGISQNEPTVAFCKAGSKAAEVYQAFRRLGYDVRLYAGSCAGWERSGQRVEKQPVLRLSKILNTGGEVSTWTGEWQIDCHG